MVSSDKNSKEQDGGVFFWRLLGGKLSRQQMIVYGLLISVVYQGVPATFDLAKGLVYGNTTEISTDAADRMKIKADLSEIKKVVVQIYGIVELLAKKQKELAEDSYEIQRETKALKNRIEKLSH